MTTLSKSAPSLLGVGGSGGGGSGSSLIGSSFNFDTSDKRLTRLHGTGVKVDVELLEINAAGGILRYTPTHIEWEKGNVKWQNTFSDSKISIHHNDRAIIQFYAPDESPHYFLSVFGNAGFNDIILDQQSSLEMLNNLCLTELSAESGESSQSKTKCTLKMRDTHLSVQQTFDYQSKVLLETTRKMMSMSRKTDDTAIKMTNMEYEKQNEVDKIGKLRIDIFENVDKRLQENNIEYNLKTQSIVDALNQYKDYTADNITNVNISLVNITNWIELMIVDINNVIDNLNSTYSNNLLDLRRDVDNYDIESIRLLSQNSSNEIEKLITNVNQLTPLFDEKINNTLDNMNGKFDSFNIEINSNFSHIMNIINENVTYQNVMTLSIIKETNDTIQGLMNDASKNTDSQFANISNIISDNITTLSNDITSNMDNITLLNDTLLEQINIVNNSNIMQSLYNHRRLSELNESLNLNIDELKIINIKNISDININLDNINDIIQSIIVNISDIHSDILYDLSSSNLELTTLINDFTTNSSDNLTRNNAILVHVVGDINQTIVEEKENTKELIEKLSMNTNNSLIQLHYDFLYNLTNSNENLTNYILNNDIQNRNNLTDLKESFTTNISDLNDTILSEISLVHNNIQSELNFTKSILLYKNNAQDILIETLTNDIYVNATRDNVVMNDTINLVNSTLYNSLDLSNNLLIDEINTLNKSVALDIIELTDVDSNMKSQLDALHIDTNQSISRLSSLLNDSFNNASISFQQQLDSNNIETTDKLLNISLFNNNIWNSLNNTIKLINYGMNKNEIELKDFINLNQVNMLLNVSELNRSTNEMNQVIKSLIEMNSLNINNLNSSLGKNITLLDLKMKNINELLQQEDNSIREQIHDKLLVTNDTMQFLNKSINNEISLIRKEERDSSFNIYNQITNVSILIGNEMNHMNNTLNSNIDNMSKTTSNSILKAINDAININKTLVNEIIYVNNSILSYKNEMNQTLENQKQQLSLDKQDLVRLELNVTNKIISLNKLISQSNTDNNDALINLETKISQNISNLSSNIGKKIIVAENKTNDQLNVLKVIIDRVIKTEQDDIKKLTNDLNITIDKLTSSIIAQMLDHSNYINNSNSNTLNLIQFSNTNLKDNFTILSNDINKNMSDFHLNTVNSLSNMKEHNTVLYDNLKERVGELYKEQMDTSKIVSNSLITQGVQAEITKALTDKIDLIDSNLKTSNNDVQNLLLNTTTISNSINVLSKNSLDHDSFRGVMNNKIDLIDSSITDLESKYVKSVELTNYLSKSVDDKYEQFEKLNKEFKIDLDNINEDKNKISNDLNLIKVNVKDNTDGFEKLEKNIESLSKKVIIIEDKLTDNKVNYDNIIVIIDNVTKKLNTNDNNDNISRELQKEYNKQMLILEEKNIELQNKLEKQTLLATSAETLINSQEKRIAALENESLKIRADYASLESVDSLRKLLYEMQSNMVSHSSKVLDLIISQKT
jgi:hypothetical protein